jgi:anti-sigma B factor antagonist
MPGDIHASGGTAESVTIHGRVTIGNSGEMRRTLSEVLRARPAAVSVDLSDVSYIDTSGLATLVEAVRIARRQGTRLTLGGMLDQPRYLFEITHLDRLFEMDEPEACA